MAGTSITLRVDDEIVGRMVEGIEHRMRHPSPVFKVFGQIGRTSIVRNFEKGGRPEKWAAHSETTKKRRGEGAAVLRVQGMAGGLAGSIHPVIVDEDRMMLATDKVYAATHQFGAKKGSFGTVAVARPIGAAGRSGGTLYSKGWMMSIPWGDIPAREFMMLQDEDEDEMSEALKDFVLVGRVA